MKTIKNLFLLLCLAAGGFACTDEFEDDLVKDNRPEVPVTFAGTTTYGFNPYYTASLSDTAGTATTLDIQMNIPQDSQRNLQEISKVIVGGTAINAGNLTNPKTKAYAGPVAIDGKSATFTTGVRDFYLAAGKLTNAERQALSAPNGYIERAMMFLVTLDDGSQVIPVQVRVRFTR